MHAFNLNILHGNDLLLILRRGILLEEADTGNLPIGESFSVGMWHINFVDETLIHEFPKTRPKKSPLRLGWIPETLRYTGSQH